MGDGSRLWLVSAGMLTAGAGFAGAGLVLYWRPCAANMFTGSVFNGYRYDPEFTDACLEAMDRAPGFPLPGWGDGWSMTGVLGIVAALFLAAAWLVLLPTVRCSPRARLALSCPALAVLSVTLTSAFAASHPDAELPTWPLLLVEVTVPFAVVLLAASGVRGRRLVRYALVLLATTAVGLLHQIAEYIAASTLSDANWDAPPGTGSLAVVGILLTALATVVLWRVELWDASSRPRGTGQAGFSLF